MRPIGLQPMQRHETENRSDLPANAPPVCYLSRRRIETEA